PHNRRLRRWPIAVAVGVVLAVVCLVALFQVRHSNAGGRSLAEQPYKLRSLPTDKVIQAGLEKPELPWAWQELEKRAKAGDFHSGEASQIFEGLTAWIKRQHP